MRLAGLLGLAVVAGCAPAAAPERTGTPEPVAAPPVAAPDVPAPAASEGSGREVRLAPTGATRMLLARSDTITALLPNGDSIVQYTNITAWVDMLARPEGDGFRFTFTVDSLIATAQVPPPPSMLDSARATRWTALVGADGTVRELTPDRSTLLGAQVEGMLRHLVPPLPGTSVRVGATWSDTTVTPLGGPDVEIREEALMNYIATGPVVRGSGQVVQLTGRGSFTQEGTATQFGQQREFDAEGTRAITRYLGVDGALSGFDGNEAVALTVSVPAVGQTVEVRQRATYRAAPAR